MNRKFSEISLGAPSFPSDAAEKGWETANVKSEPNIRKRQADGFTLMELLIVISIIVILMLIAIPTSRSIKKHANELSAQKSLQTIEQAESIYGTNYPSSGYACTLPALAGESSSGAPSSTASQLINGQLSTGIKDGYIFNITACTKASNTERITGYTLTAVPATPGRTGDRGFCLESGGAMKMDPTGGSNCTQMVQ